ncbi:uncharacterized protein LOC129745210 [Uranotaenia lowii]|uniref:uncharacterized protein LOC129745210 n=1 Tax=Uranotaenia lowii TaxID=190385 RepID=UPI00247A0C65|nr:uncharacterized protein LOC129745210 [Uranotaenia lowii]
MLGMLLLEKSLQMDHLQASVAGDERSLFKICSKKLEHIKGYKKLTLEIKFNKPFDENQVQNIVFAECLARINAFQELVNYIKMNLSVQPTDQLQIDYLSRRPTKRCSTGMVQAEYLNHVLLVECVNEIQTATKLFLGGQFRVTVFQQAKKRSFGMNKSGNGMLLNIRRKIRSFSSPQL